jgi:uncharacterized small protein (DUF1192 family)
VAFRGATAANEAALAADGTSAPALAATAGTATTAADRPASAASASGSAEPDRNKSAAAPSDGPAPKATASDTKQTSATTPASAVAASPQPEPAAKPAAGTAPSKSKGGSSLEEEVAILRQNCAQLTEKLTAEQRAATEARQRVDELQSRLGINTAEAARVQADLAKQSADRVRSDTEWRQQLDTVAQQQTRSRQRGNVATQQTI